VYLFHSRERGRLPIADIEVADVHAFCKQTGFRLPTQDEWEYLDAVGGAQPAPRNKKKRAPVGSGPANALGLFDMRGNVAEWCTGGAGRPLILMGGCFADPESGRTPNDPDQRAQHIGFRVVRDP
jgi:formylglycine-generating enzyme required for sulfatase activity